MNLKSIIKKGLLPLALAATIALPSTSNIVYANELIAEENMVDGAIFEANAVDGDVEDESDGDSLEEDSLDKDSLTDGVSDDQKFEKIIVESDVEVVETNTVEVCPINVDYTKEIEIYDGFIPTGETTTMSLYTTIELEYGASLSSIDMNSDTALILDNVQELKGEITSGYTIKASIDLEGKVSISSVETQSLKQDSTDVTVYKSIATVEKIEKDVVSNDKKDIENSDVVKDDKEKSDVDKLTGNTDSTNEECIDEATSHDESSADEAILNETSDETNEECPANDDKTTLDDDEFSMDVPTEEKFSEEEE
ncbi:hypothetical protein SAMN02910384_00587 [Pseudobutyrivibrio sp. ACV-2]|uniref:hypothetical protein n=1 Tax=Pseudobutyrivibrio sp. ACV-2 TaxID=1520801 RepID=UPI00089486A9|nr:hypothetical protein [Pseudobutyrivibrio sp. ACV-2]SEA00012.1 hypothetical protein SAMN02910384_00587 [Pseudobutyrivibrio sp. ACV-2]